MEKPIIKNENEINQNSYMTKEAFISMLQQLHFVAIERTTINFITGFVYNAEKHTTETRGFDITIN